MALGLGTTRGSSGSNSVGTSLTAHNTVRTFAFWAKANVWSDFMRVLDKFTSGTSPETIMYESALGNLSYNRTRTTTAGKWSINTTTLATGTWGHYALTYDDGLTSNDPQWYRQGATIAQVEITTPNGTVTTNSDPYVWGNRGTDFARVFDGDLAELCIWNALLTGAEIASLYRGFSPLQIRRNSLIQYIPLVRPFYDLKDSGGISASGTIREHPPIMGMQNIVIGRSTTAASSQPPRSMHQFRLRAA
jgi:hypothetical protein